MRRQLLLTVAASTVVVLVAFLVPLALLVRSSAADRAQSEATLAVQPLAAVVGVLSPADLALSVSQVRQALGTSVTVYLADGTVLGDQVAADDSVRLARSGSAFTAALRNGGREVLIPVDGRSEGRAVVRVEIPASKLREGVRASWAVLGALGLALLVFALLVADRLARSFLEPLHALTETTTRLGGGDLNARLQPAGPPEVAAAGRALNALGSRIGDLLVAEREAAADLSHRLRTPVTALRLDAESLRDPVERARMSDDVTELSRAVDRVIAEARRPVREGVGPACDAATVVRARVDFWQALADDTGRQVTTALAAGPLTVRLAESDLVDAVDALLGNVFAHTADGTAFSVTLQPRPGGGARLVVADGGGGLPDAALLTRGASGGGSTGLGLDIARRSADASGGALSLLRPDAGGTRAVLDLGPAGPASPVR